MSALSADSAARRASAMRRADSTSNAIEPCASSFVQERCFPGLALACTLDSRGSSGPTNSCSLYNFLTRHTIRRRGRGRP